MVSSRFFSSSRSSAARSAAPRSAAARRPHLAPRRLAHRRVFFVLLDGFFVSHFFFVSRPVHHTVAILLCRVRLGGVLLAQLSKHRGGPVPPPLPAVGARAVSGARPVWCVSSFPSDRVRFSCLVLSCQRAVPSRRARPAPPLPAPAALGPTLPSCAPLLRQLRMPLLAVGPSPALQPAV